MAGHRQSSTTYTTPPSPYQQRISSAGSFAHGPNAQQASPLQASPLPPPPPMLPRHSSAQNIYNPQSAVDPHRSSQSQSDREKSLSVSPKTRVPSLPSSTGQPGRADSESRHSQSSASAAMVVESVHPRDQATIPAKRKPDERDLKPEEL